LVASAGRHLCYDSWGGHGRPVILIPPVLFDRTTWWPVAADLRPYATVIAVDLPGHGASTPRPCYQPDELVDDLAALLAHQDLRQAPVLVTHGACGGLAAQFASRYATHALLALDPGLPPATDRDAYLRDIDRDALPEPYRGLAAPATDPRLLADYHACLTCWPAPGTPAAISPTRLARHSRPPGFTARAALPDWQHETYHVPGRFPQLMAVDRVVRDLRTLL
jgi:pimeloyl-ACP methyl ester carboxylesterase